MGVVESCRNFVGVMSKHCILQHPIDILFGNGACFVLCMTLLSLHNERSHLQALVQLGYIRSIWNHELTSTEVVEDMQGSLVVCKNIHKKSHQFLGEALSFIKYRTIHTVHVAYFEIFAFQSCQKYCQIL